MTKQITVKQYVYWQKCKYTGHEKFGATEYDFRLLREEHRDGMVFVKEIQTTFEVPDDFNPVQQQIADLEAIKAKARAEFQASITEIDRQIQSLLAIEHVEPSP